MDSKSSDKEKTPETSLILNSGKKRTHEPDNESNTVPTAKKSKKVSEISKERNDIEQSPKDKDDSLASAFAKDRLEHGDSPLKYKFNKKRVRMISQCNDVSDSMKGILYWMYRDQRVQDNWAFIYSQRMALKCEVPLHVCYCLVPEFDGATKRQYDFLLRGLEEVSEDCRKLNIYFHLFCGKVDVVIPEFVENKNIGGIVTDFSPLRSPLKWLNDLKEALNDKLPICQVDAHNIVPVWQASPKQEYAARTIRKKITDQLPTFLTHFPPIIKHPYLQDGEQPMAVSLKEANAFIKVDEDVGPVKWAKPGYVSALKMLKSFAKERLYQFNDNRNDPTKSALSNLSPWFNFGHLSVQRSILYVKRLKKHQSSTGAFIEEAIIRRELSDNFCFYNKHYDEVKGAPDWAQKTLNDHRKDKREYVYSLEHLENGKTHDNLWNASQKQLVREGKMHGFLRMYWAKKILEWTKSPEEALKFAIYLNDRFNLDGRDPNGFVGCMWSICGIHDQGWTERPIFGKIRYMNYQGCKRKFNVDAFVMRYR